LYFAAGTAFIRLGTRSEEALLSKEMNLQIYKMKAIY
jgi:hypothetical protein